MPDVMPEVKSMRHVSIVTHARYMTAAELSMNGTERLFDGVRPVIN